MTIKYLPPRESLGRFLSKEDGGGDWDIYYNDDQKEYWYKKADRILSFLKHRNLL